MQNEIKHTLHFNQPQQVVWDYLTKPELLEQWLTKTDFKPIPGQKFNFYDKTGKIVQCEVLEVHPFTHLSYSWLAYSAKTKEQFNSTVVWKLVPQQNGTELQLTHNGFIALEDFTAHNNGWTRLGVRFTELLNTIQQ